MKLGVVHRDVKPGNIMIDHDGEPILTDFGLARRDVPEEVELTIDGQIIGSPAYMSPEQINCHRDLGPAADIYSLGVTFFELVSGQRPFSWFAANAASRYLLEVTAQPKTVPRRH